MLLSGETKGDTNVGSAAAKSRRKRNTAKMEPKSFMDRHVGFDQRKVGATTTWIIACSEVIFGLGLALFFCAGVNTSIAQVSNSPAAAAASEPQPLMQFNLRFVTIERDPGAPRGKPGDPLTNVVMLPLFPEGFPPRVSQDERSADRSGSACFLQCAATNRSGLRVCVTNNRIVFRISAACRQRLYGQPIRRPVPANGGSLHAVFDFYPKAVTDRKIIQVETVTRNSDFIGSKTAVDWERLPAVLGRTVTAKICRNGNRRRQRGL